jgi:pentatricopeptide repeat protein
MPSSKATAEEHNSVDEIERREMVRSMLGDKSLSSRRTVEDLALLRRVQERGPGAQPTEEEAEAIKRLADNTLSHAERRNDLLRNPPDERESLRKLPADYASLSEHMRAKGESPRPVDVYAQLLRVHAAKGSPESVDAVVREMRERGVPLNLYVYGALVHSCAAHGDAERARKFMRELEEVDGLKPTVAVYGCYIDALTRTGNLDEALSVVDKLSAEDSPVKPNAVIYTSLIRGCFHANRIGRAWKVYQMMVESGAEADAVTGSLLIRMCAHKKECERAEMIFGDLVRKGEVPDVKLYSALIRCFATRYDYYPKAFEAFKAMVAMGIRPNREVFTSLLVACSRIGDLESAERVMNQMAEFRVEKDDIVYNTFIAAIANSQQYPRMKVGGVEATVEQRITLAVNTLAELRERGIPISLATLNSMLGVYAYANRIKRSEAFFREAYAKFGMQPDQFSYLAMMRMYARTKQVAKGRALYQEFLDKKLPPLKTFFRKAIVLFGATRQFLSAQRVLDVSAPRTLRCAALRSVRPLPDRRTCGDSASRLGRLTWSAPFSASKNGSRS